MMPKRRDPLASLTNRIQQPSKDTLTSQDEIKDSSMPRNEADAFAYYKVKEGMRIARWLVGVAILGYVISITLALLQGWRIHDFYLNEWMFGAIVAPMSGGGTYTLWRIFTAVLQN